MDNRFGLRMAISEPEQIEELAQSAETRAAKPAPEDVAEAAKTSSLKTPVATPAATPAPTPAPTPPTPALRPDPAAKAVVLPTPRAEKPPRVEPPAPAREPYVGPDPVTTSELLIAIAGAVIAVVAGFYLISSAF
jgi:hypothetical protein